MKLRFFIALILAKTYIVYTKVIHDERSDRAGLLAFKICPNFSEYIKKPPMVIMITGTNGKTTTTNLINNIFNLDGKKTVCNDWGANTKASHAKCLIDGVTIFNKSKVDVAILEADEMTSPISMPPIKPTYLLITNICRDSIRRNANYYYIKEKIEKAVKLLPNTKLILNADDPLSSFVSNKEENCTYYAIDKSNKKKVDYNANDFTVCPVCYQKIEYLYQHYRHIGKVKCTNCDFKSKNGDYIITDFNINKGKITIKHLQKEEKYDLAIDNIFNTFNYLSVITLFREIGMPYDDLKKYIAKINIPKSRKDEVNVNGITVINQTAKGQNVSASSCVFQYLSTITEPMEIVIMIDEVLWHKKSFETITWLYETDFEFLNIPNLRKIIVTSKRYKDYQLRLLLAGLPKEKIVCIKNEQEAYKYLELKDTKKIFILYEVDAVTRSHQVRDSIIKYLKQKGGLK